MDPRPLQNAVIAVTNAGRGFGHAAARALGRAGATVIVVDADAEAAAAVASELEAIEAVAVPIKGDFTIQAEVSLTFDKITEIFGNLAGLVQVADGVSSTPFRRLHSGEWNDYLDTNVRSTFLLLQALRKNFKEAWATVVLPPLDSTEPQTRAARNALCGLIDGLAEEGQRVNAVQPTRSSAGLDLDQALGLAVLGLAIPATGAVTGSTMRVALPPVPDPLEGLPPEALP
ncbi:MAG TPA: SDR family NAD(P)-dependent oxidoreductase [Deinococcales bacterium]|nr:SDR family NAD(P)-dependent oxidoreductase [Deinococcales bacterium]